MKALILAAGYGERLARSLQDYEGESLQELLEWVGDKPKGLVSINVNGTLAPLLHHHVRQLRNASIKSEDIYIQTNSTFYSQYLNSALAIGLPAENVLDNGVQRTADRKSPLGDLRLALDSKVGYEKPLLVLSSDTLVFNENGIFDLNLLMGGFNEDGLSRIVVYEGDPDRLRNYGLVQVDENSFLNGFQEKPKLPENPKSNLVNASVHLYSPAALREVPIIHDQLGFNERINVLQFLYNKHQIKVEKAVRRLDVGTIQDVLRMNVRMDNIGVD